MKWIIALLAIAACHCKADCPEEIHASGEAPKKELAAAAPSAGTQPISNWDPALKPPFPMGPLLVATAPVVGGPWLYRKTYNPAQPTVDPTNYSYYDGNAGHVNYFESYDGLSYYWTAILQINGQPMATLKSMLADAALKPVTTTPGPVPGLVVEWGGLDPVTGKTFILMQTGASNSINTSSFTTVLIDLANRWCN